MGLRFLYKRRLRTALTILAIMLGVGILTGINATADSMESAINKQIYEKLGNNDIIIRGNRSVNNGWFDYTSAKSLIEDVSGIDNIVPRIIKSHRSYPLANKSINWNVPTIAIDTGNPNEKTYGSCNISAALNPLYENTSRLEDLFQEYSYYTFPVVLSIDYANSFNIEPGDAFYVYAENPGAFEGMAYNNTSTWHNATVIGIIKDTSESVRDFMPPAKQWELRPPSTAVYVDIHDAWTYIFNSHPNQVNMIFSHVENPILIEEIRETLENLDEDIFPGRIFTENVKALFTEGILQVNTLMRGIFSIFSAISLLVCAIIIKNLLEMAKEEQTHEIGIMRALGVTKSKIMELYIVQILFISLIGSVLGLVFGYFLSYFLIGSYAGTASVFRSDFADYQSQTIIPTLSGMTILIGISAGVIVSLIFGFFPARSAANVDPLEALSASTEKPKRSLLVRTIGKSSNFATSLGLTIAGIIIIGSAFSGLYFLDIINPEIIGILFIGVILLIVGIVLLGAFFFPIIVPVISKMFIPILRKMHTITGRNLKRYSRQTKNTFAMLAIGLCMMITVGTIMNSAYAGAYPGGRTVTGGDIRIGNFYEGQIPKDPHAAGILDLPSVVQAVPIRFSLGFEGLTRIDRIKNNRTFGGYRDATLATIRESFHLGILEPSQYADLQSHDSIVELTTRDISLDELMEELKDPYTVILQDKLARRFGGLEEGEWVRMRFDGFEAQFKVIGIFKLLPGIYWSYYLVDNANDKQFAGIISWNAYEKLVDDNIGKADVLAKNKVTPPEEYVDYLPEEKYWGYASTPMDYKTLEQISYQTGLVKNSTRRVISPFPGIPSFSWKTNVSLYDSNVNMSDYDASPADPDMQQELGEILNKTWALQDVLWHEDDSINRDWNSMFSTAYAFDPAMDKGFGNTTIKNVISEIPENKSKRVEDIFEWADKNLPDVQGCVINEIYVNLNLSTGKFDYVKKFNPGETVRLSYDDSIHTDFYVLATTNSHYNYEYVADGKHFGDTAVFNYEALSYNTYTYDNDNWDYFFEVLSGDPNSIFIPNKDYVLPTSFINEMVPDILNSEYSENLTGEEEWWINQSLAYMYLLNASSFSGILDTDDWEGTYSYDGNTFTITGTTFTYEGSDFNVDLNVDILDGEKILNDLKDGILNLSLNDLISMLIFDLDDNMTYNDIKNFMSNMEEICSVIPTLKDITFFSPKIFLLEDSKLFHAYFLIGTPNKNKINSALFEIESYYVSNGLGWNDDWVYTAKEMEEEVGGILGLIVNMFFGVLSFALIASLLGLSISTLISVKRRYAEIGTLRTLGFSNFQVLKMIVSEGLITAILGVMVGTIAGLLIASLIVLNLPFMIFLPIIFAPPLELIGIGIFIVLVAAVACSFIPAVSATRIDISDAIRTKGE